jgi:hypothetical protein
MFFRFGVALVLVVAISLAGTGLEKQNLELKRIVSRQHYRLEILREQYTSQRVVAHQLGAPARLIDRMDPELLVPPRPEQPAQPARSGNRQKRQHPPARKQPSP